MATHRRQSERIARWKPAAGLLVGVTLVSLVVYDAVVPDNGDESLDASLARSTAPVSDPSKALPNRMDFVWSKEVKAAKKLARKLEAEALARQAERRRQRAIARETITTTGPLGELTARRGKAVTGSVSVSVANIPNTRADARWYSSMRTLVAGRPDFVTLNEVFRHPTEGLEQAAPGYTAHRAEAPDNSPGASGQSMNNALLYRSDTWTQVAGGMVRVVNDDRGFLRGKAFVWDRFAVWSILRRADGAVVSLISTHMPTNPGRYPRSHGGGGSRVALYAQGMDTLVAMTRQLAAYGPVLVGGDMNSHASQGSWTAAAKMTAAGFSYVKDQGVMYLFYSDGVSAASSRQVRIYSDHPALLGTLSMNGTGPTS